MKKNKEMLMLAGIDEATNYPAKSGLLEAVLWQIRSSLSVALEMVDGKHGSGHIAQDPQKALDFLKNSVRKALEESDHLERSKRDLWDAGGD